MSMDKRISGNGSLASLSGGVFRAMLPAIFVSFLAASPAFPEDLTIGMMKVSLMPEFDAPSILVINEGKFLNKEVFPREAVFFLPSGVTKLTDACSLSPGGQHFCQLFDIENGAERNTMKVKLPYPDFFIDFQYTPFTPKKNADRNFDYGVESGYDIKNLVVVIQQPYRAERFKVEPDGGTEFEKEGYKYYKYTFSDLKKGEKKVFHVSYFKADEKPSVDSKFSPMAKSRIFQDFTAVLLVVAGVGGIAAMLIIRKRAGKGTDGQS